jgi:MoaA/NifB/PqqE/SkfB family radical SAM enzyme
MKNSLTYLTRRCPRNCEYCALRDAKDIGPQLGIHKWIEAFKILKALGVEFNLILGNEPWLLGEGLLSILKHNQVPFALYTTCPEPTFSEYKHIFFESGYLDNLSCGIDYPVEESIFVDDDSYRKSIDAWHGFKWIKKAYPEVDTQGTITIHKKNIRYAPKLVENLSKLGVFIGINFIHWNKDGLYDFFPKAEEIKDLLFTKADYKEVSYFLEAIFHIPNSLLQNPEFISQNPEMLLNMGWHCKGNPYGGPTIDADGHLRCCGYRRGTYTPKFTIFDLPEHLDVWEEAVHQDAMECPGCAWSYPWMTHYWANMNNELGKDVFIRHGGNHIPKDKWSKRIIS